MQLSFDLTELTVDRNRHGQDEVYQENREHFANQTEIVLSHLIKGERITGEMMYRMHKIQDVRPRIAKCKKLLAEQGLILKEERIEGGHGAKTWWLEFESDKAEALKIIVNKLKKAA